jgi:glycogen phosphorylase
MICRHCLLAEGKRKAAFERQSFGLAVDGFDQLVELALDLRWSWNHAADELWRRLDPDSWESAHNPWLILQTVSRSRVQSALADPEFKNSIEVVVQERRDATGGTVMVPRKFPGCFVHGRSRHAAGVS